MNIDVVIPTITGRERYLRRAKQTYRRRSTHAIRLWVEYEHDCVGKAWNAGAEAALADGWSQFLHLTNDDIEPQNGWDDAAISALNRGFLPSPRMVDHSSRTVEWGRSLSKIPNWTRVESTTIPFVPSEAWGKIGPSLPIHYYTDDWLSLKARLAGFPSVFCYDYVFLHTWATAGRGAGTSMESRMIQDHLYYEREVARLNSAS
jgi:GT2 family glycosyltransferase